MSSTPPNRCNECGDRAVPLFWFTRCSQYLCSDCLLELHDYEAEEEGEVGYFGSR